VTTAEASVVEAVAKYFFFSCLDEQLSFTASLKVLSELKARNWLEREHRSRWIETLRKWKPRMTHLKPKPWTESPLEKGYLLPQDFDLSVWVTFLTAAEAVEVEAVLLSRILAFTDEEIADGLSVTTGTVRYRVGRGLRHLGGFIES
jgi:DNA-directed RNA polymerase specialized sigma24 family protein